MEFKLTQRDKKLLVVMSLVLIIVGFVFLLILPAYDRGQELTTDIQEAETVQNTMATAIASYPTRQIEYEEMSSAAQEVMKGYYPIMTSQEIDKEVTGIVVSMNGQVSSLNIVMKEEAPQLQPYYASAEALEVSPNAQEDGSSQEAEAEVNIDNPDSAESLADQEASGQETGEEGSVSASTLRSANVGMTVQGGREILESVVDYFFNNCPGILVNSYTYGDANSGENKVPYVYLDMELYMCDKENGH